jgi:hypothetical protein
MVKRARGSNRPAQRRQQRPAATTGSASPRPSGSLTEQEAARAAELEAKIVAEERAANEARSRNRERSRAETGRSRDVTPLAARTVEYAYVRRDVSRILALSGVQLLILVTLFILINVTGIIQI